MDVSIYERSWTGKKINVYHFSSNNMSFQNEQEKSSRVRETSNQSSTTARPVIQDDRDGHLIYHPGDTINAKCGFSLFFLCVVCSVGKFVARPMFTRNGA